MIQVLQNTTSLPISTIGHNAGVCYNSDITNNDLNYKRGLRCIKENHGEMIEFPIVSFIADGYSARVVRELFRHRHTTKAQSSTRYVNYDNFSYYTPKNIADNEKALKLYKHTMDKIKCAYVDLIEIGIPKEDVANLLPLGMCSKIVFQCNLRELIHICNLRLCSRAYVEARKLCKDLIEELRTVDSEWKDICDTFLKPRCKTCTEKENCENK